MEICACLPDVDLQTLPFRRACRYQKVQGQKFREDQLVPAGMCPHLYRSAYPYCLSLLYDASYDGGMTAGGAAQSVRLGCPSNAAHVRINITIRRIMPLFMRRLKRLGIRMLQFAGIDGEFPDKNVIIEVAQVRGKCPLGLQLGQKFRFNIWNRKELCPASFYTLYLPFLQKMMRGAKSAGPRGDFALPCPDPSGVVYRTNTVPPVSCEDFFGLRAAQAGAHRVITYDAHAPCGSLCPLAYYAVYPYYLTLTHGGVLEWVRPGHAVQVNCPMNKGIVMEVSFQPGDTAVAVKVVQVKGDCPKAHARGDEFRLAWSRQPDYSGVIAELIPFLLNRRERPVYACNHAGQTAVFQLE